MKILFATSFFPPTHTAGTEKRTFGYAKTMLERGHQVQVVCAGDWELGEQYWVGYTDEIYEGIPVRRVHLNWQRSPDPNAYLYANPEIQKHFMEWLSTWEPDLVHITSCITLSASILQAIKDAGLPIILTLTDFWFVCHKLSLLRFDGELCDGNTTSQDCIQCLGSDSGVYRKLNTILSNHLTTEVLNKISKVPVISRQRGFRGHTLNIKQRKTYLKEIIKLADVITSPSNHLRDTLHGTGITNAIRVIQSGHDLSWLDVDIPDRPSDRIRFGYIGQLTPTKGVHTLISAFQSAASGLKAELHIYGDFESDPAYYQELQNITGSNRDAITFHGAFPHIELGTVLAGIDMLIVPSLWHENNPRVIQEAYAGKTPVIASDVGGISDYVDDGSNGFLFKRGDISDLRAKIIKIVEEPGIINQQISRLPKVKSMADEMDEFEMIYNTLQSKSEV